MKKILISLMLLIIISSSAFCDYPAKPTSPSGSSFSAGSILTATQLNLWFNALYTWANGGIMDSNIASASAISFSKLNITSSDLVSTLATDSIPYSKLNATSSDIINTISSSAIPIGLVAWPSTHATSFTSPGTSCTSPVSLTNGKTIIYFDGIFQIPTTDYSASGTAITSTYTVASGTTVQIVKLD